MPYKRQATLTNDVGVSQRAILVGTKICHENVQEKEIYDATGITISSENSIHYVDFKGIIF